MKPHLMIVILCLLCVTVCFSGCEQFYSDSEQVRVNVMVAVSFTVVDEAYTPLNVSLDGAKVYIKVLKNGSNRVLFERFIQNNLCQATDSVELQRGEWIECLVNFPSGFRDCYPLTNGSALLTWETATAQMNLAGVYNWYPHISMTLMQRSPQ